MHVEDSGQNGGVLNHLVGDSVLTSAMAGELTSPLILLRQLGLAVGAENISEAERKLLGKQLTLTSERALRLASSLSMTTAGQQALALEPVNPVSVCREVIHELTPLFAAYDRKITLRSRLHTPLTVANRKVLQRILLLFGDNALHYSSLEHPIQMTITGKGEWLRVGVRDWGPAVPINMWQQLDGRVARRAAAPLSNRPQMSGVSLITARHLAGLMDSVVGTMRHRDGATFYIDLRISNQLSLL